MATRSGIGTGSAGEAERLLVHRAGGTTLGVAVSRVTGIVREQLLAALFPTAVLDAFVAAFTLPSTLREMLAEGALSKAFLTVFAQTEERSGRADGDRLLALTIRILLPALALVVVVGIVFAPELVDSFFSGAAMARPPPAGFAAGFATVRDLTVWMTRLMFPFLFFISLAAVFMGGLHARHRFFLPAVASAFFNVTTGVFALAGALIGPEWGIHPVAGLALGVPVGGLVQLGIQWRAFRRTGFRPPSAGAARSVPASRPAPGSGLRQVGQLFVPVALAAGSLQIHVLISRHFASMGTSWLAWVYQGYRLAQTPAAFVGVALSHAGLPALSRAAARRDHEEFLAILIRSGRLLMILSLVSAAGLAAIAEPLVAVIYQHGVFRPEDAAAVTTVIRVYVLGLPAFGAAKILTDAFFALGTTRPPLAVTAVGTVLVWFVTDFVVLRIGLGYPGIPLGTVVVAWISTAMLFGLLAPRLGRDGAGRSRARHLLTGVADAGMRGLMLGGIVGAAAWLVTGSVDPAGRLAVELAVTALATAAGVLAFAVAARRLVPVEFGLLRDAVAGLFGRRA